MSVSGEQTRRLIRRLGRRVLRFFPTPPVKIIGLSRVRSSERTMELQQLGHHHQQQQQLRLQQQQDHNRQRHPPPPSFSSFGVAAAAASRRTNGKNVLLSSMRSCFLDKWAEIKKLKGTLDCLLGSLFRPSALSLFSSLSLSFSLSLSLFSSPRPSVAPLSPRGQFTEFIYEGISYVTPHRQLCRILLPRPYEQIRNSYIFSP